MNDGPKEITLAIVIPTLDASRTLPATLDALRPECSPANEVIVSDCGSVDGTTVIAMARGCSLVSGPRGRGGQLARGAAAATSEWLLFLHADTVLGEGWADAVRRHAYDRPDCAAAFRFALDDPSPAARRLERLVLLRNRVLAMPYGDQGLLVSRALYDRVGGYADMPLMEDVDLVRRIGRRRLQLLPVAATTSAARYLRDGYLRRIARNAVCLAAYGLGVPPRLIARAYG